MKNEAKLPTNISEETKKAFRVIESEGYKIEANLCNGYYGHALHVPIRAKAHFENRFPNEKFIGVI
jgi:hypothetical protein